MKLPPALMLASWTPLASMSTATAAPYQPFGRLMVTLACPRETGTTVDAVSSVTQAESPTSINNPIVKSMRPHGGKTRERNSVTQPKVLT